MGGCPACGPCPGEGVWALNGRAAYIISTATKASRKVYLSQICASPRRAQLSLCDSRNLTQVDVNTKIN